MSAYSTNRSSDLLLQLSDEVRRIAGSLARLSTEEAVGGSRNQPATESTPSEVSPGALIGLIRARRLRTRFFAADLFADPAWDMLLELLHCELTHQRVPVSSLCIAAQVPATTALRWINTMVQKGLFIRRADPHDGRRVFVELAPEASAALRRYFAAAGGMVSI